MSKIGTRAGTAGDIAATTSADFKTAEYVLDEKGGFGVFAFNTSTTPWSNSQTSFAPNFMYNQKVYKNEESGTGADAENKKTVTSWQYQPLKYWPNGIDSGGGNTGFGSNSTSATQANEQIISFFAYAPWVSSTPSTGAVSGDWGITAMTAYDAQEAPKITYTFNNSGSSWDFTAASNVDLLWGLRGTASYNLSKTGTSDGAVGTSYNTDITKTVVGETIDFQFKHALAAISDILAVLDVDAKGAAGLSGSGSLDGQTCVTIQDITIKSKDGSSFVTSAKLNLATGEWTDPTYAAADLIFTQVEATTPTTNSNPNIIVTDANTTYVDDTNKWNGKGVPYSTAASVYTAGNFPVLYVIPGQTGQTLRVSVTYIIKTKDNNLVGGYSTTSQTITNDVSIAAFANNTRYKLILHLGLASVRFSANVANWTDGTESTIWLPSNVVVEP